MGIDYSYLGSLRFIMRPKPKQFDLSIIIPAYREEKRVGRTLEELAKYLAADTLLRAKHIEIIVVSADSPDATHATVMSKKHLFSHMTLLKPGPKVGKGRDVQFGMLRAKGKAILFMDADLATPLPYLSQFYQLYSEGADIVAATRNLRNHHDGLFRRLLSSMGNILFRIAGGVWIEDSQCGFKLFSHEAAQVCFSRLTILGWGFDMEILAIAKTHGLRITSVRVEGWESVPEGTFAEGAFKNALTSLGELAKIAFNRIRGTYRSTE